VKGVFRESSKVLKFWKTSPELQVPLGGTRLAARRQRKGSGIVWL